MKAFHTCRKLSRWKAKNKNMIKRGQKRQSCSHKWLYFNSIKAKWNNNALILRVFIANKYICTHFL